MTSNVGKTKNTSNGSKISGFKYQPVDAHQLEAQLRTAIEEDKKYERENAAKFRAVEQCKSYDEFREFVKAAHLKPLEKKDLLGSGKINLPWNSFARRCNKIPNCTTPSSIVKCIPDLPQQELLDNDVTHRNFEQYWISFSVNPEKRIQLLHKVISNEDDFKMQELSADLIGSILKTLLESLEQDSDILKCDERLDFAIKVMKLISSTSRFSLNMQFLDDHEKNISKILVKKMTELLEKKENRDGHSNENIKQQIFQKYNCREED